MASIFGGGLLLILVLLLFLIFLGARWELMGIFLGLLRFMMAICAGLLSWFLLGRVVLVGKLWGMRISAAGGMALFIIIMFLVDPFPGQKPPGPKKWEGGDRLGSLLKTLKDKRATGEIDERIEVAEGKMNEILNFKTSARTFSGRTWAELVRRICEVHTCLKWAPGNDRSSLVIDIAKALKPCNASDGSVFYVCPEEPCD
jgi:hypothetical protein